MSTPSLPSYSHAETPLYSRHPRGDEQTLRLSSRPRRPANVPTLRDWTKKNGNVTLTLMDLPGDMELPVYGLNTTIGGFLTFTSTDGVASVQIKVEGHVKCKTIAEIGRSKNEIFSTTVPLWHQNDSPCPAVLPFKIPFPNTFTLGEETGPLPPSFEYTFYDVQGGTPGLRATIKYSLQVNVELVHPSLKDRLSSSLSTKLIYLPRSRPTDPISSVPTTVFEAVMEHRVGAKSREPDPIIWKLILPKPGTYSLKQPIPFRVSVTSRSPSLIAPFAPSKKDKAAIRVYALRQLAIKVHKVDLWRSFVIGEGTLTYMPQIHDQENAATSPEKTPSIDSDESVEREGWMSHDWTGVLNIDQGQVRVGGFKAGGLTVKDYIVLSVVPPNPRLGSLLEVKRVVSIQLTTDSWEGTGQAPIGKPSDNHASPDLNGYLEGGGQDHLNGASENGASNGHNM